MSNMRGRLVDEDSQAAQQAKQMGLVYKGFGRWADPQTGKVTYKSQDGRLIPVGQDQPQTQPDGGTGGQQGQPQGGGQDDPSQDPSMGPQGDAGAGGEVPQELGFSNDDVGERSGMPMPADWDTFVNKFGSNEEMAFMTLMGQNPENPQDAIRKFRQFKKENPENARDFQKFRRDIWNWSDDNKVDIGDLKNAGFEKTGEGEFSAKYTGPNGTEYTIAHNNASVRTPDGETKRFSSNDYASDTGAHNAAMLYALNKSASDGGAPAGDTMQRGDDESEDDFYDRMAGQFASQDRGEKGLDMDPGGDSDQEKFKAADRAGELPLDGPTGPDTMGSEPPEDDDLERYGAPSGTGGLTADRGFKKLYKAWHDADGRVKDLEQKIRDVDMGPEQYDRAEKIMNQLKLKKRQAREKLDRYSEKYQEKTSQQRSRPEPDNNLPEVPDEDTENALQARLEKAIRIAKQAKEQGQDNLFDRAVKIAQQLRTQLSQKKINRNLGGD